ncbi:DUF1659 domain-containing protein [Virgibacillus sp. MSP4-1]|uniref:DUF1659 domain-containing protein n=1 Tax=Virgibacillus sp. MSP4-1 TaxID=2700081 RepID=UPI0003A6A462|nr:DUF1659 domain-containing protein [Virgibacillus sp. MSP4-1]QHS22074.1 DUF1659 domain-containing protein [Virgibacillus sp. MSP4-1]
MAVSQMIRSQLQLVFEAGPDSDGEITYKNKNFNNVKTEATADQLMAVTNALVPLQERSLYSVERNDSSVLVI